MEELQALSISVGDEVNHDSLIDEFRSFGYVEQDFVATPGDFSVRGHVIDIFPLTYRNPVRIAFNINLVESIKDFSLISAKNYTNFNTVKVIPYNAIFQKKTRNKAALDMEPLEHLSDLIKGDYVVHLEYGIGKYLGSKMLTVKKKQRRFIAIEYDESEILYIDPKELKFMERYMGLSGKKPKLSKLHSKEWAKIKEKTKSAIKGYAQEVLELQAKRNILKGIQYKKDVVWQKEFEGQFKFELTSDQKKSTKEIKLDMEQEKPMDRLLCGDVGYGKTEVALRAAFKAVMGGRQVAFLVPTTILAEQHFLTLTKRVEQFPVRIEVLSRFKSKGEQKKIIEAAKEGLVDILIGTHRLFSADIQFNNLGLVIIDEEQRFGVKHKDKLKKLRELVDVLTLTATPIPRTLYLSLMGVKDMSQINTPPKSRLPVYTEVTHFDNENIKNIFYRELERKGQIYFVHNRVESIEAIHKKLKKLLPNVRFAVAHGQLSPKILENIILRFMNKEIDCLVSTNIIESGLDIPNANTIIVNRSDNFGLSDLYQLRGRVGRYSTKRKAYAYFLVPEHWVLTEEAQRRLSAIERFTELGSGFKIAMEDLEIRGAGNLLGSEQSGFIYQVGFDMYCRLLQQTIHEEKVKMSHRTLKGGHSMLQIEES